MTDLLTFRQQHLAMLPRIWALWPSGGVPLSTAVSWEAGKCYLGCGKGRGLCFSFLPSSLSCSRPGGPNCYFPRSSWAGLTWAAGGMCGVPAHVPSVSLLAGISQLLTICRKAVSCLSQIIKASGTEYGFPFMMFGGNSIFLCLSFLVCKLGTI